MCENKQENKQENQEEEENRMRQDENTKKGGGKRN
jgi:hypothetical protein